MNPVEVAPPSLSTLPILYSFRRCPYAIRARMALLQSGQVVELREVALGNKPQALRDASPKATVPVLVLTDGTVIDESLAIMRWTLGRSDPSHWLEHAQLPDQQALIALNDGPFKRALDAYKYPERHPDQSAAAHRSQGEAVLVCKLETILQSQPYLSGEAPGLSDVALFPFIRQWAAVDRAWFDQSEWVGVRRWLDGWLEHDFFAIAMQKYPNWSINAPEEVLFSSK